MRTEKLEQLFNLYKFPVLLGAVGFFLFFTAIVLIVKTLFSTSEVVFQTEASPSAKSKIRVDVAGAVLRPDVYELEDGSRVSDGLSVAGGLSKEADREWIEKNLNLAAKLIDGGKIYIPSAGEKSEGKAEDLSNLGNLIGLTAGKTNINLSSQTDLESLPSVGPVTAKKIINGRPYQTIEELKTKKIVGTALYEKIKELITL